MNDPQTPTPTAPDGAAQRVSLWTIAWVFFQMGALGFGGGLVGWLYHEAVARRRWMDEIDFASMVTLGQTLPGVNICNYSVYTGQRLRGPIGSIVALFSVVIGPVCIICGVAAVYTQIDSIPWVHHLLVGTAVTSVGLVLSSIIRTIRKAVTGAGHFLIYIAIVVVIGVLRWPMVPVLLCAIPASLILAWFTRERSHAG
jgi:chromate transporter